MKESPARMDASTARQEALFTLALAKPAAERGAFLDRECGGDAPLRQRVEALLAAHAQTDSLLATDVEPAARPTISLQIPNLLPDEAVGQTLGRYKLLERLGEGGCGVVYVAEQTEPVRRRVALKVIKLGMDTKQVVARFEAERQALAMMDHPNISKVLDAGTTDAGRPFFVMELVRGIKITDYCDQAKLNTQARLDLFIKVCQAIQHAHQKGIIHRDIKPSNILVTLHDGVPVPKVIDFGIAKATEGRLTDATVYTQLHQFIGTPAYMSPEQAEMSGLDIDTRSDIYSLGVLLYELLAGSTPFDAKELVAAGIDAMRKIIREQEPPRPSTRFATLKGEDLTTTAKHRSVEVPKLIHQIQGDLDWIVMKCLEKDRARRYETANGLAADLKRHLSNEPVVARPPSVAYKFQKAWRRNRLLFTAGAALAGLALVALLAVVGLAVAIPANRKLTAARDSEAEQRREKEQALERAEIALYHRNMAWAEREWQANNVARVLELLTQCPEADRGWEWHRLNRLCHSDLLTLTNDSSFQSVAWHPSGLWLMGSGARSSQIWDVHQGVGEKRIGVDSPPLVGFLPGGFESIGATPVDDAKRLAISDVMTSEQRLLETPIAKESVLVLSPDGSLLAAGSPEGEVRLTKLGVTGDNHSPRVFKGAAEKVNGVAFSPIGGRLAICTGKQRSTQGETEIPEQPGSVVLWDPDHDESHVLASGGSVFLCVAFSFDGEYVMAGTADHTIRVWETASHKWIATLRGHSGAVLGLSASPNSQQLASCSADSTIRVWDLAERMELRIFRGHQGEATGVAFSPNGRCLASTSSDLTVKVWDALARSDELGHKTTSHFTGVAFDPRSPRVAATGESLELLDRPTPSAGIQLQESLPIVGGHYPQVAFDSVGSYMATTAGSKVELRFSRTGKIARSWTASKNPAYGVAFSPDGTWLATSAGDEGPGEIRIWLTETGELIRELTGHSNAVWGVAASPDGRQLATAIGSFSPYRGPGKPGEVIIWDVATGDRVLTLPTRCCCYRVAFSPDGRFLAAVGGLYHPANPSPNPGEIKVWDAVTGRLIWSVDDPSICIFALAFSPDGRRLATGGGKTGRLMRGAIRLWDVPTGDEVLALWQSSVIRSLDFSRDGWSLASAGEGGVRISDARPPTRNNLLARRRELLGLQPGMDALWIKTASQRIEAVAAANPTNLVRWQTLGRLRKNAGRLEAATEAYTNALALAGTDRDLRTAIQRERYDLLFKLGRTNEAIAANLDRLGIPERDPHAKPTLVNLSLHYTASFTNYPWARAYPWGRAARDNGVEFPIGIRSLNGIDFDLRGICHTWGGDGNFTGIRVGRLCRRIHFLHAAIDGQSIGQRWTWKDGFVVGRYIVHRKGLPGQSLPVAFGQQLGFLFGGPAATSSPTAPNVAWTSAAEISVHLGRDTRLYNMTWENPKPDALVEMIDLLPELNSPVSPVLFAITVED